MAGSRTYGLPAQIRAMVRSAVSDHHRAAGTAWRRSTSTVADDNFTIGALKASPPGGLCPAL